jgi:hypothetical protein
MSFAEFQIRLFAYKRVQEREWEKTRLICWYAMTGSHQDPKKMPKSLSNFMKLDLDIRHVSKITEAQKLRFLEATAEYLKEKNKWQD